MRTGGFERAAQKDDFVEGFLLLLLELNFERFLERREREREMESISFARLTLSRLKELNDSSSRVL